MKNIDFVGRTFNRLTVLEKVSKNGEKSSRWKCLCECGNTTIVFKSNLQQETTVSCGCFRKENQPKYYSNLVKSKQRTHKEGTSLPMIIAGLPKNNTSGVKGVSWDKSKQKWLAQLKFKQKNIYLGRYSNKQDAINARKEAEEKYFKPILEKYKS